MTGSPTPTAPTDAYAQVRLLTPERVPRFFTGFRDLTMHQINQFKWLPRKDANNVVHKAMQPSVRFTRAQCMDLPPTTYSTRSVTLSPEQAKAYKQMYEEMCAQFSSGSITAANAGVQMAKLLQIGQGFTYTSTPAGRGVIDLPHKPRLQALVQVLSETDHKAIVFSPFRHSVEMLAKSLTNSMGAAPPIVHGGVPFAERSKVFSLFQNSSRYPVLVAQPAAMSHGLTLTAADTIIWYGPVFSLETYEQANARITRPGQQNHTHIVHIEATPAEKRAFSVLRRRGNMMKSLLEMFVR